MIEKTVTYKDYDGNERTETFFFHLTQADIVLMEHSVEGGFDKRLKRIVDSQDNVEIAKTFKKLILDSYGEKSPDGRRFIKNEKLREEFSQTEAFSIIFMSFLENPSVGAEFIKGIMPEFKQS